MVRATRYILILARSFRNLYRSVVRQSKQDAALEFLADIATGDSGLSPIRTEPDLADFFGHLSEWEPFGHGFLARCPFLLRD